PAEELNEEEWVEVSYNIAQGLRNLNVIYLPDGIVLGGGVAIGRGNRLIDDLQQMLRDWVKIVPVSEVRLSRLGYETALHGALVLAIQGLA
ncbi:MAG: ROK family protein, partial [Anaerolineaceae bacterium]|nr:ROK family protein [Anaerolineaceae bacterium]